MWYIAVMIYNPLIQTFDPIFQTRHPSRTKNSLQNFTAVQNCIDRYYVLAGKMSFAPSDPAPGAANVCVGGQPNPPPNVTPRNKALLTIGFR